MPLIYQPLRYCSDTRWSRTKLRSQAEPDINEMAENFISSKTDANQCAARVFNTCRTWQFSQGH